MATSSRAKVCLVACGSFNPITNMHLRLFELAKDTLHQTGRFEVVGGIVSPVNDAYGKKGLISGEHRLKMCKLATASSDWIRVVDWEVEQKAWTPTRKTMEHYENTLNSQAGSTGNKWFVRCNISYRFQELDSHKFSPNRTVVLRSSICLLFLLSPGKDGILHPWS
eukprot:scpid94604/ scgid2134/ Nicotinamide mononucleotide adenylyltransferase 3; Nicotinate-nucleotide adenylyltransferase 1